MVKRNNITLVPGRNHYRPVSFLPGVYNSRRPHKVLKTGKDADRRNARLLTVIPHEINSPVATIMTSADLIERSLDPLDRKSVMRQLQNIRTASSYMMMLFNDYLSVEQIESGALKPNFNSFNLKSYVEEVVSQMRSQTRDWQDIRYEHKGEQTEVSSDKSLLHHCLTNLISNAIKYSAAVTHIDVITEIKRNSFTILVNDRGIGIPAEESVNIFKPFFRASNADCSDGSGLGLNIVKTYAELMGGKISFQSELGKGTTFELKFESTPKNKPATKSA